jgi:glycogen phosphorylase
MSSTGQNPPQHTGADDGGVSSSAARLRGGGAKSAGVRTAPGSSEGDRAAWAQQGLQDRLQALSRNLWWTWHPEVAALFRDLDPVRWRQLAHNPIALLAEFPVERLEQRVDELAIRSQINGAYRRLSEYLNSETTWGATHGGVLRVRPVAYFSAEFGLHESLPIYSGGLGVLAGDHVKSASDLDVPLVGVGLFYAQGYFRQHLDRDGWQREESLTVNVAQLPMELALKSDGKPLSVRIETRAGSIVARIWILRVGRTTLLLLDSDVEGNQPEDRQLTAHLYGGDNRVRIHQELLLGVGGVRALQAIGIYPSVFHLNEGHSAFAPLEVIRGRMVAEGLTFEAAFREVASNTVFTTHTPVPAGHDRFSPELIEEHLGPLRDALGLSHAQFMGLGRINAADAAETFCMTVLALRLARRANAVSALHGRVSRAMWPSLWPGRAEDEVPIGHVTNGVHAPSWLAPPMHALYDRHLGPDWEERSGEPEVWSGIAGVDDSELWETHQVLKGRLIDFARRRCLRQCERRGEPAEAIEEARQALSQEALTIGFARRFATYKRATLILRLIDRLQRLVNNPVFAIQFVFAGKAHPRDELGKQQLQTVARMSRDPSFAGRVVFIEDYDIDVGRHLVQGVDVWLNVPRRPLEASGTSGQKVVLNGGLNLSVLDGWWAEAYDGSNGFAVGRGESHVDAQVQDARDAEALYQTLEQQVIPLFYERDFDGLPRAWIARMKRAIRTLGWRFNSNRMVMDYVRQCYLPAAGGLSCAMGDRGNPTDRP